MPKDKFINLLPVLVFIAIAITIHLFLNSSENHYVLAGADGPYLPVQVKSLFEHYRLAFPDMPLLFVLCTFIAKLLFLLKLGTENDCILMAIRFCDSYLPPLAAIPVYFISKELFTKKSNAYYLNYFLVAFAILNITPLFFFSFQLQKNGLATIIIFSYLYYILKLFKYEKREDLLKAITILILCLLTHFGSFGLLLFITIATLLFSLIFQKYRLKLQVAKNVLGILILFTLTFITLAIFDYTRFIRLLSVPFKIFEAPALLFALHGQNLILMPPNLLVILAMNFLAIAGLLFLIINRKSIETYKIVLGASTVFCALFMSNPMLGLEWASRLFMMAYIPITLLYLILYSTTSSRWFKIPTVAVFVCLLILSFGFSFFDKIGSTMNNEAYAELQDMKDKNIFNKSDAIVARQSLRILSNWVFDSKGVDKYLLTKEEYKKYPNVYLLKQVKGKNPHARGNEPNVGDSILQVYKGEHFEVYKLTSSAQLPDRPEKIFKGIRGTVHSISGNTILVTDIKTNKIREVKFNNKNQSFPKLFSGMKVEINGEWTLFSLTIKAETIREIKGFEE